MKDHSKSQSHDKKNEKRTNLFDKKTQKHENEKEFPCVRVSIGNQVYSLGCFARFNFKPQKPYVSIRYKVLKANCPGIKRQYDEIEKRIVFSSQERVRYFSNEEDDNGQPLISNNEHKNNKEEDNTISLDDIGNIFVLLSGDKNCNEHTIVLEMRHDEDFQEILTISRKLKLFGQITKLSPDEVIKYSTPLVTDSKREKKRRLTMSNKQRRRSGNKIENGDNMGENSSTSAQKDKDIIILVYPFDEEQSIIEEATKSLCEPSGMSCRFENESVVWYKENHASCSEQNATEKNDELTLSSKQTKSRTHYLTIRNEDLDRLDPEEFLNDTLIDFWMRW